MSSNSKTQNTVTLHETSTLQTIKITLTCQFTSHLPHTPLLGFSNSAANKDMMSKISTNGDTIL